jgi:serine/threonine protein kinase
MSKTISVPQVLISYSREDAHWLEVFHKMLKPYVRRGEFNVWADTRIHPSADWQAEIEKAIEHSKAVLLLVSPNFLASDFIAEIELPAILKRVKNGGLTLLWVPLSCCPYRGTDIERFQAIHDPKQPLEGLSLPERNFALTEICEKIKAALLKLRQSLIPDDDPELPPPEPKVPREEPQVIAARALPRQVNQETGSSDLEYQMLFGALAAQNKMITAEQLTEALVSWSARRSVSIAEQMMERQWLEAEDKAAIDHLLQKRLRNHQGDLPSTLAAVADPTLRHAMRSSGIREISDSLDALPEEETGDAPHAKVITPRYEWIRVHREGPLGQIWLGRDSDLERDVALKTIGPDRATDPRAQRRFLREAQIAAKLEHPNIVPVYELAQRLPDWQPFYAMRFLRGKTLSNVIGEYHQNRREGQGEARERRRLLGMFLNVCNAVAYAHSRHVLHRDLKPDNVILGDFGEVYLLDWGLAKEFEPANTGGGQTVSPPPSPQFTPGVRGPGSPAYMSPEQAANRTDLIDPRTDVYGLGAILFELLTGKPPHSYEGLSLDEILKKIVTEETPSARAVEDTVPPPLDDICKKAMAWANADRYPSVKELAAAVQLWLDEEPLAVYRANAEWFEKLVHESPEKRSYREGLAKSLVNLGLVLSGMDRPSDAEQTYRRAIAEYEKLLSVSPKVVRYRADLAACRLHLRSTLKAQGREADAETVHREAIKDYEALIREDPADKQFRLQHASLMTLLPTSPEQVQQLGQVTPPEQIPASVPEEKTALEAFVELTPVQIHSPTDQGTPSAVSMEDIPQYATVAPEPYERTTDFGEPIKGPRYRILRLYARGGLGQVSVAYDEALKREVALKEIGGERADDSESRARFLFEAEITAGLEHPGIVPVYSLGQYPDGRVFYVMRLIKGESLQDAIKRFHEIGLHRRKWGKDAPEFRKLLYRFLDVCNAIQYAHDRGVLHRDLKPANIMLGKYGETVVLDWGLAKVLGGRDPSAGVGSDESQKVPTTSEWNTQLGQIVGTPAFMSPEQARGEWPRVGPASDIFGLGATLFYLLTGKAPYHRDDRDLSEMLQKVQRAEFPSPSEFKKGIPRPLEAVCLKAMAHQPEDRYPSVRALADDLERWLAHEPVTAYREPWFRRMFRLR